MKTRKRDSGRFWQSFLPWIMCPVVLFSIKLRAQDQPRQLVWSDEFEAVYEEGLYYMLALHPQIIGIPSRAMMLEKLIQFIKSKESVWFATPYEITRFWIEKENSTQ